MAGTNETIGERLEQLVSASRSGDRRAFEELVRMYQRRAMEAAIRLLASADEAAEAVQNGFIKAYLKIGTLKDPAKFEIWLLRIITNAAISQRRACRRRWKKVKSANLDDCEDASGNQDVKRDELTEVIQKAILKLSPKEAKAISLMGLNGLEQKEIAEIMSCSIESVRWYVFCARRKLKEALADLMRE